MGRLHAGELKIHVMDEVEDAHKLHFDDINATLMEESIDAIERLINIDPRYAHVKALVVLFRECGPFPPPHRWYEDRPIPTPLPTKRSTRIPARSSRSSIRELQTFQWAPAPGLEWEGFLNTEGGILKVTNSDAEMIPVVEYIKGVSNGQIPPEQNYILDVRRAVQDREYREQLRKESETKSEKHSRLRRQSYNGAGMFSRGIDHTKDLLLKLIQSLQDASNIFDADRLRRFSLGTRFGSFGRRPRRTEYCHTAVPRFQ
jgi:hypothetical protein